MPIQTQYGLSKIQQILGELFQSRNNLVSLLTSAYIVKFKHAGVIVHSQSSPQDSTTLWSRLNDRTFRNLDTDECILGEWWIEGEPDKIVPNVDNHRDLAYRYSQVTAIAPEEAVVQIGAYLKPQSSPCETLPQVSGYFCRISRRQIDANTEIESI